MEPRGTVPGEASQNHIGVGDGWVVCHSRRSPRVSASGIPVHAQRTPRIEGANAPLPPPTVWISDRPHGREPCNISFIVARNTPLRSPPQGRHPWRVRPYRKPMNLLYPLACAAARQQPTTPARRSPLSTVCNVRASCIQRSEPPPIA